MLDKNDLNQIENIVEKAIVHSEDRQQSEMIGMEKRIITEVGSFITEQILPQLDEKADKKDVEMLQDSIDRIEVIAHDQDINRIKAHIGLT